MGILALRSNTSVFSFPVATGLSVAEKKREGHVQTPPSRGACWPASPVVRRPQANEAEERLDQIMRKHSPQVPVFSTLGAALRITTGPLMRCDSMGI